MLFFFFCVSIFDYIWLMVSPSTAAVASYCIAVSVVLIYTAIPI